MHASVTSFNTTIHFTDRLGNERDVDVTLDRESEDTFAFSIGWPAMIFDSDFVEQFNLRMRELRTIHPDTYFTAL